MSKRKKAVIFIPAGGRQLPSNTSNHILWEQCRDCSMWLSIPCRHFCQVKEQKRIREEEKAAAKLREKLSKREARKAKQGQKVVV